MAFVWKRPEGRLNSPEQVMAVIIQTVDELNMPDKRGAAICAGMCVAQESDFWCPWNAKEPTSKQYPYDSQSDDGRSVGYYQQQTGPKGELWWGPVSQEMDLKLSTREFLTRLKKTGYSAANAQAANDSVQAVQRSGVPQGYTKHWDRIQNLYDRVSSGAVQEPAVVDPNRPPFNEFPIWSKNNSPRASKVDAFFLHTQEGGGGDAAAENLAKWFQNANNVSYHYTISQAADGGVTVVDCVDTDQASWSVLSANARSINLCFAGSRASWTRADWMKQSNAIDVAAYLAVQDAKKYGFAPNVIAPPYTGRIPGISDHRYVTKVLGDGTHTDVGDGFPWDVFAAAVAKYAGAKPADPKPEPPKVKRFPEDWTDRELMIEILRQKRGPELKGWPQLGNRSEVDALGAIGEKLGIPGFDDRGI